MKKVIIIGAGPAGLTAGYELLKYSKEYEVIILEESNDIGGISKTVKFNNNRMDIGGHRFFSKDENIMNFWKELMPLQGENSFDDEKLNKSKDLEKGGPNPDKEDKVMLLRDRVSRIYYLKKFFDYPITLKLKTFTNMGFFRTTKVGLSYIKSLIIKKKEDCLENFYINRFGKSLYKMFFEKYTEKIWGRHPSQIAADWGAQRVKGVSIGAVVKDFFAKTFKKQKITETSLIEKFWYPKFGPGQLWEILADEIEAKGGIIKKGFCVKNINIENKKIKSVECLVNGKFETISGDIFISSMPIKDFVNGIKGEKVPKEKLEIARNLPYRDFITVGLLVKKLNLKNTTKIQTLGNIVPDCWIYIQEPDVKMSRIQIFNNWSPYLLENPEDSILLGLEYCCDENDEEWKMNDKKFIEFAINELVYMNIIEKDDVIDSHREKVKKAYPAYFDSYENIDELISYLNGFENLYCIGRNGQHRYNNMDHSMATAMIAVKNIHEEIKDKSDIWNVNTEKEYHEIKKEG